MAFPPSKNSPPQAPQQTPAQGSPGQSAPPQRQAPPASQQEAQHSDMKQNDAHSGGSSHQSNGHATPAQQSQHQAAINQNHGAGTGAPQRDDDNDGDC